MCCYCKVCSSADGVETFYLKKLSPRASSVWLSIDLCPECVKYFQGLLKKANKKRQSRNVVKQYLLYHGDDYVAEGTFKRLARLSGLSLNTVRWLSTPAAHRRQDAAKKIRSWTVHSVDN